MFKSVLGIVLILAIYMLIKNNTYPELGIVDNKLRELDNKPHGVSSQTDQKEKKVDALEYRDSLEESKKIILSILKEDDADIIVDTDNYIRAVYKTKLMRYKDDVEFYFDGNLVQYRSESRVGYSDAGLNLKRYKDIKRRYQGSDGLE
ncbi:MAG: DUF1499 domain-containing protein [Clostridia bacterium]|jgi:uncharacterized protein (DUF1499 family)|nr:DUF1499 domain-containing protein [Clostridia bacterium]